MSKLTPLQRLLDNDLRTFQASFFEDMEVVPAPESSENRIPPEEARYRVPSLDIFESWYISGIVGGRRPSTYSGSPGLWNTYYLKVGRKGVFFAFDLPPEKDFTEFLQTLLFVPGLLDLTVTDPYKNRAYRALQDLDYPLQLSDQAEQTRAVNHVILDANGGRIIALNTDGIGMIRAVKDKVNISDKKVLIIGAGGSAASIGYEFVRAGNDLFITNRTPARAEDLGQLLAVFKNPSQQLNWGGFEKVAGSLKLTDIVVNSVAEGCPLGIRDADLLKERCLLAETKYGSKSELRDLAIFTGCDYVDGKAMLFGQFEEAVAYVYPLLSIPAQEHKRVIQAMVTEVEG